MQGSHVGKRILLALGVIVASLIALPYVLRTWPDLPWEWVRFVYVIFVIVLVVIVDRLYRKSLRTHH